MQGRNLEGNAVWHAIPHEGGWISTSREDMLVRHQTMYQVIAFWLERTQTDHIVWDRKLVVIPSVIPKALAELVCKDLKEQMRLELEDDK